MAEQDIKTDAPAWPAMWRGMKCKCPNCGEAWLFRRYIEQVDECPVCHERLGQYNVGLFLPLIVITIIVFVIGVIMLEMELNGRGNPLVYLYTLIPLSIILPLLILPSAKGALIGLLWAKGWSDEQ